MYTTIFTKNGSTTLDSNKEIVRRTDTFGIQCITGKDEDGDTVSIPIRLIKAIIEHEGLDTVIKDEDEN